MKKRFSEASYGAMNVSDAKRMKVGSRVHNSGLMQQPIEYGAAPVWWTVYRLRFLISSPSILHPKRSLPPQAAEAPGGSFLQSAKIRPRIKLQVPRSRSTPGLGMPANLA